MLDTQFMKLLQLYKDYLAPTSTLVLLNYLSERTHPAYDGMRPPLPSDTVPSCCL
jgi:hypothetical protein